ncbi:MAG TPA: methyltransferase domain-containing protein [Actinomycetota bacterium]|nr:methyltransferase domain-containing protein [Actinomycetota bacterium]
MSSMSCPICLGAMTDRKRGGFSFSECSGCGFGRLLDSPGREDYWAAPAEEDSVDSFWIASKSRYFSSALDILERRVPDRRLLDIGGGIGFFSELALKRGWDPLSLDVSEKAAEIAAERVGAHRSATSFPEDLEGSFDVVTLWCVVAHTHEPEKVIDLARRALTPGGIVWLTTPNYAFQKTYMRVRAGLGNPLDVADHDHVVHFTPTAIRTLLESGGFESIDFVYRGITETCIAAESTNAGLLAAKKAWNAVAHAATRVGLPNRMSELQVIARRSSGS